MSSEQRIAHLRIFAQEWEQALADITKLRDALIADQSRGFLLQDSDGNNLLPDRIAAADAAVLQHQEILIRMQSLLGRALSGEDV